MSPHIFSEMNPPPTFQTALDTGFKLMGDSLARVENPARDVNDLVITVGCKAASVKKLYTFST